MKNIYLMVITIITIFCIITGSLIHLGNGVGVLFSRLPFISIGGSYANPSGKALDNGTSVFEDDIRSIDIDAGAMSITIKESDRNAITCDFSNKKMIPTYELKNGVLTVAQKKVRLGFDPDEMDCTLIIEVEADIDEADIALGAGNFTADGVNIGELDIENGAGEITLKDGDFDSMDVETGVGNALISNCTFKESDIESGTGNVDIMGLSDYNEYEYDLDAGVGNITLGGTACGSSFEKGADDEADGTKSITIEVGVGDINISD